MPTRQRYCCICSNHAQKWDGDRKIKLHRFPADPRARRVWLSRCRLVRKDFKFASYDSTRLCSDHFHGRMGPTPLNPLPTIFPTKTFKTSQLDENIPDESMNQINETQVSAPVSQDHHDCSDTSFDGETQGIQFDNNVSRLDCSLHFNDYCGVIKDSNKTSIRNQETQTYPDTVCVEVQTEDPICGVTKRKETKETSSQTDKEEVVNMNNIGIQVDKPLLTYEDVKGCDEDVFFYTGIPDSKTFDALFDGMKTDTQLKSTGKGGRPSSLRLLDEFFLVLMRLRLGLLLEDLATRFRVSSSTCGRIFNKWINYLDVQLSFLVQWPDRECVQATMSSVFKSKYSNCRVIIDCTEIRTETPSSLQLHSLLYSDYKSHMTYKSLVGISPAGAVTFVSDLYNGSVSDKQITKLSGLVDLCEEGDSIMADKGFLISDLTTPKGVKLIIPPFKHKKKATF